MQSDHNSPPGVAVLIAIFADIHANRQALNVLKLGLITLDTTLDEHGRNKHIDRLVALRHWAEPLKLEDQRLTVHVLEAMDPASAILEFAQANHADHILIGAPHRSLLGRLLGGVSGRVVAEAPCTVTIVRPARTADRNEPPSHVEASRHIQQTEHPGSV
jgi:nucleotide-binding universal stress UspA family protein